MLQALIDLVINNDYTGDFYYYFGIHEDHPLIDLIFTAKGL